MGGKMSTLRDPIDPMDLARRDSIIGGLILALGLGLVVASWALPEADLLGRLGSPLVAAAFGAIVSGFWSARIARSSDKGIKQAQETMNEAVRLLSFKDPNFVELDEECARYCHLFWRTEGREGSVWRHGELTWRRIPGVPIMTATLDIPDLGGNSRRYEHVLFRVRGRFVILITNLASGEPTAVHIIDAKVMDDRLFGVERHMSWMRKERLAPSILATSASNLEEMNLEGPIPDVLSSDVSQRLDQEWSRYCDFSLNLPSGRI